MIGCALYFITSQKVPSLACDMSIIPFGFVWQIASATGWSVDYILDGVNYQTLILMLSDAPRYVRNMAVR